MRISDWSSDVCSSDLVGVAAGVVGVPVGVPDRGDRPAARARFGEHRVGDRRVDNHRFETLGIVDQPDIIVAEDGDADDFELCHGYLLSLRPRSEEHTSELQSLMRISYAVFCLKKKTTQNHR